MVSKFFFFAVVSVAFAQAQGYGVESAIQRGLVRAKGINESGRKRIDASIKEVEFKLNLIQKKTFEFVERSVLLEDRTVESVGRVADAMRTKAEESKKPNSVFECIDRVEENCNNQVQSLTRKFETDMQRLEKVKLENVKTASAPLNGMQEALRVRYERAVKLIKESTTPQSVETALNSFSRWLDTLSAEMGRVKTQVGTVYTNYIRDAENYYRNMNNPINRIRSTSIKNIRACIYNRAAIFEEY